MAKLNAALIARNAACVSKAGPLYDQINQNWEKVENFLRSTGILAPVEFEYCVDQSDFDAIGIQKISGKWRICHGSGNYQHPDQTSWTPLSDCSLELRTGLLRLIPGLVEALVEANEKAVPRLQKAVEESNEALKLLGIS